MPLKVFSHFVVYSSKVNDPLSMEEFAAFTASLNADYIKGTQKQDLLSLNEDVEKVNFEMIVSHLPY